MLSTVDFKAPARRLVGMNDRCSPYVFQHGRIITNFYEINQEKKVNLVWRQDLCDELKQSADANT